MLLVSLYSLIAFTVLMGAQIWRPRLLLKFAKWTYLISIVFVFLIAAYLTVQQYRIWQTSGLFSKVATLPLMRYALHYGFTNFFLNPLMALVVSGLGWLGIRLLNRRAEERFFERAEAYLFATGIFLSGHPNWIFYTISVFGVAVVVAVIRFLFTRSRDVVFSFYYFWIPIAALTVILSTWFKFPFSN